MPGRSMRVHRFQPLPDKLLDAVRESLWNGDLTMWTVPNLRAAQALNRNLT